jgi:hypothetical protein
MAQDIFKGTDVEGEPWEAWRPITDDMQKLGARSFVVHVANERCSNRTARALDAANSARLGSFLLSAAGVDIVSAAREACDAWREDASIHDVRQAMNALAAELAKLDALEGGST